MQKEKDQLSTVEADNWYYNLKRVKRRENNHSLITKKLRTEKRDAQKQLLALRDEIQELQTLLDSQTVHIAALTDEVSQLRKKKSMENKLRFTVKQKVAANKQLELQICELKQEVQHYSAQTSNDVNAILKEGGHYSDNVRLCVFDLLGLEVATANVPNVIQTVALHIFNITIKLEHLPTRSTVLKICDEGHYLSKLHCVNKLKETEHYGIGTDGTSRKGKKIVERHLTLANGVQLSLGYNTVASETADAITSGIQREISELVNISMSADDQPTNPSDTTELGMDKLHNLQLFTDFESILLSIYLDTVKIFLELRMLLLEKLGFLMSDRAANEKKSHKQILEWVESEIGKI